MSEYTPEITQCDHVRCPHPYRAAYCEIDGSDIEGPVVVVAEFLETIMYEESDFERGGFAYESFDGESTFSREFNLLLGNATPGEWSWPLEEMRIEMTHHKQPSRQFESFTVTTGWIIHQTDAAGLPPYRTTYTLELWPTSAAATISEYDIRTELLDGTAPIPVQDRPMLPYDHEVLFSLLSTLQNGQLAPVSS